MTVMLVNRATGQRREPVKRPERTGKTAKDHASGAWRARLDNQRRRAGKE